MAVEMIDLDALERAAQVATPGEWVCRRHWNGSGSFEVCIDPNGVAFVETLNRGDQDEANGNFIAAANPTVVLELVRRLRAAERDAAHWKANHDNQVERARVLVERTDMPLERVLAYRRYKEMEKGAARYEKVRKFMPRDFQEIWQKNLAGAGRFDELVDAFDLERR